jgi:DNA-binding response OmpR family regulator
MRDASCQTDDRPCARVLVVEDEWLISQEVEVMLQDAGYDVVGPVPTVASALSLIEAERIDTAVLDIHLGREKSFPIAQALISRAIPFVFVSGYACDDLPLQFRACPLLSKPVNSNSLLSQLQTLLSNCKSRRSER